MDGVAHGDSSLVRQQVREALLAVYKVFIAVFEAAPSNPCIMAPTPS